LNTLILSQKYLKAHQNLRDFCIANFIEKNPLNAWSALWREESFEKLSSEIDLRLNEISKETEPDPEGGEASLVRLWWITFNSLQEGLPLIALNSPLEDLYKHYLTAPKGCLGRSVATYVFLLVGALYNRRSQHKLAVLNLSRAEELSEILEASKETKAVCLKALVDMLKKEEGEAKTRREPRRYREDIEKQLASVKEKLERLDQALLLKAIVPILLQLIFPMRMLAKQSMRHLGLSL